MLQDSKEIKTIEQWRWSEMQGLELVSAHSENSFKDNASPTTTPIPTPTTEPTTPTIITDIEEREGQVFVDKEFSAESKNRGERREMEVSEGKKDGGDGEKPGSALPTAGFGELFRFADKLDYVLMAIGTVGAFIHGCSLPLFLRFFAGGLWNPFLSLLGH